MSFIEQSNKISVVSTTAQAGITGHGGVGGGRSSGGSGSQYGSVNVGSQRGRSPYALRGLGNEYENGANSKPKDPLITSKSGRNISTLQIVFILTIIMSLGFAGYYFVQFYPFICSKEAEYDVMGRSSVTPTQSGEFEYESASSATKSTNASYSIEHDV